MLIPVRCFSCGAVVADKYDEYAERVKNGESADAVLDALGVQRYCCRRMFVSHRDVSDEIMKYVR
jgi:DNA-directed RNA polymerase subunit N